MSSLPPKLTPTEYLEMLRAEQSSRSGTSESNADIIPTDLVTRDGQAADVIAAPPPPSDSSGERNGPSRSERSGEVEPSGGSSHSSSSHSGSDDAGSGSEYVNSGRGGVVRKSRRPASEVARGDKHLTELFERVNALLGERAGDEEEPFRPPVPRSLQETGLTAEEIERLVMKYLLQRGAASGREICSQIKLPYAMIDPLLNAWKHEQLLAHKGAAEMGDYVYVITDRGRERARRYADECTYFGAAPVGLRDYLQAMEAQSIAHQQATEADLKRAFSDLLISEDMFERARPGDQLGTRYVPVRRAG